MSLLSPSSALHRAVVGLFHFLLRGKVLALATVMICAYFAAKTVSSLVEAEVLLPTANAATTPVKRPPAPTSSKPTANPNVISERNIFCSTCEPDVSYSGYQGQPAVLIATSVADSGRRATVRVVPTDVQGSWGLDETIPGVGKITRIGGTSIDVVDDGNHQKTISLLDGAKQDDKDPGKDPSKPVDPFASRVRKINDTTYEVDRSVISELMASAGQGAGAQAMPVMDKGEVKGLRLLRVKPTSVAAAIGLKSNDILSAIDNDPIKTMQGVLDAIARVDTAKQMALQGTRGGKPLEVTLRFR